MTTLEEAYLAQRIFRGEFGRYAKNWDELFKIANFRFEGKKDSPQEPAPFGDDAATLDAETLKYESLETGSPGKPSQPSRNVTSITQQKGGLVVEPIGSDGNSD